MDKTEKQVIDELFARLQQAEQKSGRRDAGAEDHIKALIARQPAAPYYMAQAILVQEHALKQAQSRIAELEQELESAEQEQSSGGFLGGLFGGGARQPSKGSVPRAGAASGMRYPGRNAAAEQEEDSPVSRYHRTGAGGGFLAGAAQTAVGVAGGVLLGNMIAGMFSGGNEAQAATAQPAEQAQTQPANDANANQEPQLEEAGAGDDGGWFGGFDGGDFDI